MAELPHVFHPDILRLLGAATHDIRPESAQSLSPIFEDTIKGLKLYEGDTFYLLPTIASETVDLVIADPPYFLSSGGISCSGGRAVSVDKGEWDKPTTLDAMHAFNLQWLRECQRILKPNGMLWVSGTMHNIFSVGFALQTLGFKVLNDIAWYKVNPPQNLSGRYFAHATETLIWAKRDSYARHLFHHDLMQQENNGKQMQSLWHIPPPYAREKQFGKHPTQKPEALIRRILQASSNPGDLILDPFAGSGTTGVVCAQLGRHYIGFEREPEYNAIAIQRLNDAIMSA